MAERKQIRVWIGERERGGSAVDVEISGPGFKLAGEFKVTKCPSVKRLGEWLRIVADALMKHPETTFSTPADARAADLDMYRILVEAELFAKRLTPLSEPSNTKPAPPRPRR